MTAAGQELKKNMKPSFKAIPMLVFSALTVAALITIPIFSGSPRAAEPRSPGERAYKSKCSICHATDGSGNTAKGKKEKVHDLRSPEVQKQTDAELTMTITKGKKKMKAYGDQLSAEQIQQVIVFVRELSKK